MLSCVQRKVFFLGVVVSNFNELNRLFLVEHLLQNMKLSNVRVYGLGVFFFLFFGAMLKWIKHDKFSETWQVRLLFIFISVAQRAHNKPYYDSRQQGYTGMTFLI